MSENILYSFRENLLLGPILLLIITIVLYGMVGQSVFLSYLEEVGYIGLVGAVQYILTMIVLTYMTITSFDKDIKSKNIYVTLQHTSRRDFFLGKVLSNILLLFLMNVILAFITIVGYAILFHQINFDILYIFLFQQLEIIVLVFLLSLITLMFPKNMTRIIIFGLVFLFGHMLYGIHQMIEAEILHLPAFIDGILQALYYIVPNLEAFNVKKVVLIDTNLFPMFQTSVLYMLLYVIALYIFSLYSLNKKDF